jgi:hypothetical protein
MNSSEPTSRFDVRITSDLGLALIGAVMIVLATVILIGLFAFFSVLFRMV